ncbi:uncharacterized protein LOC132637141 [Lycium barbarum]|uniref:uncharacterized protein LOC132637141 n=1 Tax=Lycium barbarum TaxID=112863 RepID=UPI00293E133A|nr:uncharacterized protein LOC132637141 [Lycium barbarum]
MANCNGNGMAHFGSNLQIEAIQTVMPMKPTNPRLSRRRQIQGGWWLVAGWIRESLGRTLDENPLLAGRLRRKGENDSNGEFEIVSNDSGVRLIEAKVPINLDDLIDLKEKRNAEAELVFWEDVHEPNPQYSPLFYVQVCKDAKA